MIIAAPAPGLVAYRALTPAWAFKPLSGAGAARSGGRFNRLGIATLYLSLDELTALREYQQGSTLLPPATVASYIVNLRRIVDFSEGFDPSRWDAAWRQWDCNWKKLFFVERTEPPSWNLGDRILASGAEALLVPSTRNNGGKNLVVYLERLLPGSRIDVHDPEGRLPRDQRSWSSRGR